MMVSVTTTSAVMVQMNTLASEVLNAPPNAPKWEPQLEKLQLRDKHEEAKDRKQEMYYLRRPKS